MPTKYILLDPRDFEIRDLKIIFMVPEWIYSRNKRPGIKPIGSLVDIEIGDLNVDKLVFQREEVKVAYLSLTPAGSIYPYRDTSYGAENINLSLENRIRDIAGGLTLIKEIDWQKILLSRFTEFIAGYEVVSADIYLVRFRGKDGESPREPKRIGKDARLFRTNYSFCFAVLQGEGPIVVGGMDSQFKFPNAQFHGGISCRPNSFEYIPRGSNWVFVDDASGECYPRYNLGETDRTGRLEERLRCVEAKKIGELNITRNLLQEYPILGPPLWKTPAGNICPAIVLFDKKYPSIEEFAAYQHELCEKK